MTSERVVMARAAARAGARGAIAALRRRRTRPGTPAPRRRATPDGRPVTLEPPATRRTAAPHGVDVAVVCCAGRRIGELWTRADIGTATYEIVVRLDTGSDSDRDSGDDTVVLTALRLVFDEITTASPDLRVAVRRSLDALHRGPDPALLTALGLTHVATFPGNVAAPQAWAGEERWELLP